MGTDEAFAREIKGGSDSREQIVKRKLAGGLLPRTKVRKTVWSRGEDNSCDVCELTIAMMITGSKPGGSERVGLRGLVAKDANSAYRAVEHSPGSR